MSGSESSDRELLEAWSRGDSKAGARLFERHYAGIARFFANKVFSDSDDLIQATFLGCLEHIERFRKDASFRTYLFSIARHKLYDQMRRQVRDGDRFEPHMVSVTNGQPSAPTLLGIRREHEILLAALRNLPIETQIILELHYWEEMRVRDIAEILDQPVGTIKTKMHSGRKLLEGQISTLAETAAELESTVDNFDSWVNQLRPRLASG